jgi:hypothetical protein
VFLNERTKGRASAVAPLFFVPPPQPKSSISAGEEWSAADNFLQKQQKQRRLVEEAGKALMPTVTSDRNYNLKAKLRCKFAADSAIGDKRFNRLLLRRQLMAPSGWLSIAAAGMLVGYRNWRRAAA